MVAVPLGLLGFLWIVVGIATGIAGNHPHSVVFVVENAGSVLLAVENAGSVVFVVEVAVAVGVAIGVAVVGAIKRIKRPQ